MVIPPMKNFILNTTWEFGNVSERTIGSPRFVVRLDEINERPMYISTDFYDIIVTSMNGDQTQYTEKRGVRFVMDK